MPNKKISQLVNKTTILSTDLFPIGDATSGQLYKKTIAELQAAIGGAVISVNGLVGTVVLDTDDIQELATPTNKYFTDARARAALSATSPLAFNSSTGVFSMPAATTSANGYLTSTDWNTFNGKENVLTFSSPLVRTSNTISMPAATTSVNGYLSSTDWNTFNNKQGALSLTVTGSSGASTLIGNTLNVPTYTLAGLGGITASFLSGGTGITYNSGTGVIATTITQYTDALARASLSFAAGSGAYNSTTGVITIPTNTSQLTNGASFITLGSLSGGTGITYNSTTGAISYSGTVYTDASIRGLFSGSTGISYNSTTGAISSTITQYTDALARGAISLTTTGTSGASTYNSTTGVLNIPNYGSALSGYLPLTGGTLTGALNITNANLNLSNAYYLSARNNANSAYLSLIGRNTSDKVVIDPDGYGVIITGAATFSSSLTAVDLITSNTGFRTNASNGYILRNDANTGNVGGLTRRSYWAGGTDLSTQIFAETGYAIYLNVDGSTSKGLTLASTGDATFSSYLTATRYYITPNGTNTLYNLVNSDSTFAGAYVMQAGGGSAGFGGGLITYGHSHATKPGWVTVGISASSGGKFSVNNQGLGGGTDLFVVQQNGNCGVGTTSPSALLNVVASGTKSTIAIGNTATSTYSQLLMYGGATKYNWSIGAQYNVNNAFEITPSTATEGTTFSTPALTIASTGAATFSSSVEIGQSATVRGYTGTTGAGMFFAYGSAGAGIGSIYSYNYSTSTYGGTVIDGSYVAFYNSGSEKMRITGGNVGINTSSPAYKLDIYGGTNSNSVLRLDATGGNGYGGQIQFYSKTTGGTTNTWTLGTGVSGGANTIELYNGTSAILSATIGGNILLGTLTDNGERLYVSGAIRATGTITANSDIRLKKNLERIENALEKVGQISGYTYNTIYDDKRHGGVIAQEIDEVFPEIVNKGNDGLLGVEYGNISALLIEALKELKEKNTALEARLQALEK